MCRGHIFCFHTFILGQPGAHILLRFARVDFLPNGMQLYALALCAYTGVPVHMHAETHPGSRQSLMSRFDGSQVVTKTQFINVHCRSLLHFVCSKLCRPAKLSQINFANGNVQTGMQIDDAVVGTIRNFPFACRFFNRFILSMGIWADLMW